MTDPAKAPELSVRGLCVSFGARPVLSAIDLDLRRGEILAVVGRSGSGKSSLVLALGGLLPRRAEWKAENEFRKCPGRQVGVVFQEPEASLDPLFRIGWQIDEVLRAGGGLGRRARADRVLDLLERVRLRPAGRFASAWPHELSGGENQRACIAAAIALDPSILLLDEPTSALDADVAAEILRLLRDLTTASSLATLVVTHDFDVVTEVADRVAVLDEGRLVESGLVGEVLASPRAAATQALVAARLA